MLADPLRSANISVPLAWDPDLSPAQRKYFDELSKYRGDLSDEQDCRSSRPYTSLRRDPLDHDVAVQIPLSYRRLPTQRSSPPRYSDAYSTVNDQLAKEVVLLSEERDRLKQIAQIEADERASLAAESHAKQKEIGKSPFQCTPHIQCPYGAVLALLPF
jgi:hypothetical protein